jgi:3-hydroxymyristoyl/3-hydroxydecanoyl-(acyl carrier protein) dehydratase
MASEIFDGLTVVREEADAGGWRARLRVEPSSRAFTGHFEGQPILPGVAHLVIVRRALRAMGQVLHSLPAVRFRQVVRPGDVIEVSVARPDGDGQCRFEMKVDGALAVFGVARGRRDA